MAGRMRRTQILLRDEDYGRLRQVAEERRCSMGQLVREAVEEVYLRQPESKRREAAQRLIQLQVEVADWPELEAQIAEGRGGA